MATVEVKGTKELLKALEQLPGNIAKKIVRKGFRKAGKVIKTEMEKNAPVDSGDTKEAIKIRPGKRSRTFMALEVGVNEKDFVGDQFYAAMVEFGTRPKSKKFPEMFPKGHPLSKEHKSKGWGRRSFENKKNEAENALVESIKEGIKEANKK